MVIRLYLSKGIDGVNRTFLERSPKIFIDKTATFQYTNVKYNRRWFDQ